MLPPAAFTDPAVLDWELEQLFRGWICVGHVSPVDRARQLPDARDRHRQRRRDRRRGRRPARLPQRLPPPRRAHRRGGRGQRAPAAAVPVPRLVLRPRRRSCAPRRTWTGSRTSTPPATACSPVRLAVVGGLRAGRPQRRGARARAEHVGDLLDHLERYRVADARARRRGRLRGRRELEGDRRELQRVPALPRRPPGAQRAQRLHERRGGRGRRRLVRRLDDPDARAPRRWARERQATPTRPRRPIDGLTDEELDSVFYFALFPNALVSLHPDYVMLHTLWPRAPDRTDVICEWFFEPATIAARRTSTPPTRSGSGTWSTARTGTSASWPRRASARAATPPAATRPRRSTCTPST